MTKRFGLCALMGASALVLSSAASMAQSGNAAPSMAAPQPMSSSSMGAPMGAPGAPGGGSSTLGTVDTTTTTTTTESYGAGGMDPSVSMSDTGTLPNTGGEPLIVSMLGAMVAGGGFALRRKIR